MSASGESFLHYRKKIEKNERYHEWRAEHAKTFYVPNHAGDAKAGGSIHWDTPVDAALRINIRHYDIPALDED